MSTLHLYEVGVILRADLSEEDNAALSEAIQGWIAQFGGTITAIDVWGRRRLAYPINRQRDGFYIFYRAEMPPSAPAEIERNLRFTETVMRFIITRPPEPKAAPAAPEAEAAPSE